MADQSHEHAAPADSTGMSAQPPLLDGIRVLDVATWIAGPAAATILADFGAEVIKIETLSGDPYRSLVDLPGYPKTDDNYAWMVASRNKRSLALDLASAEGQDVLHRLVAKTDVFVTNFPFPVRGRLGIRHEDLAPLNARMIYASLTAYGEAGEEADRPGFDSTAWWARTGMMDMVRDTQDTTPSRSIPGMGDHPTATALFGAIMTGLYRRERTGQGGHVATSLLQNGLWSNAIFAQAALLGAEVEHRPPRDVTANALANHYRCRDGRWFILAMPRQDHLWPMLCEALERPDLAADPRFTDREARITNGEALRVLVDQLCAGLDSTVLLPRLRAHRIPHGVVARTGDVAGDQQARDSGAVVPYDVPNSAAEWLISSPIAVQGEEKVSPRPAPSIGEHSAEVLAECGFNEDAIAAMRRDRVIG